MFQQLIRDLWRLMSMNRDYSDSMLPFGIGPGFIIILLALMFGGLLFGVFLEPFLVQQNFKQGGGIILLICILVLLVGPIAYNKTVSRFERDRKALKIIDHFGIIHGLRGAFIRVLVYDDGLEIRAFYHRFYIPFEKIDGVSIQRDFLARRIHINTGIKGLPEWFTLPDAQLSDVVSVIQSKTRHSDDAVIVYDEDT